MADRPEVETLRRIAEQYRKRAQFGIARSEHTALAGVVEGVIERHTKAPETWLMECTGCNACEWPCPNVTAWLVVAAAAGVVLGE